MASSRLPQIIFFILLALTSSSELGSSCENSKDSQACRASEEVGFIQSQMRAHASEAARHGLIRGSKRAKGMVEDLVMFTMTCPSAMSGWNIPVNFSLAKNFWGKPTYLGTANFRPFVAWSDETQKWIAMRLPSSRTIDVPICSSGGGCKDQYMPSLKNFTPTSSSPQTSVTPPGGEWVGPDGTSCHLAWKNCGSAHQVSTLKVVGAKLKGKAKNLGQTTMTLHDCCPSGAFSCGWSSSITKTISNTITWDASLEFDGKMEFQEAFGIPFTEKTTVKLTFELKGKIGRTSAWTHIEAVSLTSPCQSSGSVPVDYEHSVDLDMTLTTFELPIELTYQLPCDTSVQKTFTVTAKTQNYNAEGNCAVRYCITGNGTCSPGDGCEGGGVKKPTCGDACPVKSSDATCKERLYSLTENGTSLQQALDQVNLECKGYCQCFAPEIHR